VTPDDLRRLLDEERSGRRPNVIRLTLADRLDEDDDGRRLRGGLL
jgi:hypothetical protein